MWLVMFSVALRHPVQHRQEPAIRLGFVVPVRAGMMTLPVLVRWGIPLLYGSAVLQAISRYLIGILLYALVV